MQGGAGKETVGESYGTQFEAAGEHHFVVKTNHHLGTAASDIAHEHGLIVNSDGVEHSEMDETSFFDTGDDLDLDAGCLAHLFDEVRSILGLANRAGCHCANFSVMR